MIPFNYDTSDTGWFGTDEGGNLKATSSWNSPNTGATNSSGFTALPAGYSGSGSFFSAGNDGHWWSSTEGGSGAWRRNLSISSAQAGRYKDVKSYGFAARCLRD
ncbi:MAG: hypothetical protein IT216_03005 [Saprospiraceae bacterium]|nr:hypothetical protein [Saprospiraceae bacterium]